MLTQKIKIVEVIADSSLSGGPAHVLGILRNIDKKKFDCHLICPRGNLSLEAGKIDGVEVSNVPMRSKFDLTSIFMLGGALSKIQSSVNPFGPMVVHAHGIRAYLLASLSLHQGMDLIYTEHRFDADYHLKNIINERLQLTALKFLNKRSKRIISVSGAVRKFLIGTNLAPAGKITVIPNGIDIGSEERRDNGTRKIKEENRAPIIGTIGNLNIQKGQTYLIEALLKIKEHYPLATLEIIGEGPELANLKLKAKSLKLEKSVSFLGKQNDVSKYMRHWDIFVLPSIAETFGIVLLEAMQAGVPVVATKVGGIPEIIRKNENGILVEPRDSGAIAKAVIELLKHPAEAAKLKRGGLETIKKFDWKQVVKEIESIYSA